MPKQESLRCAWVSGLYEQVNAAALPAQKPNSDTDTEQYITEMIHCRLNRHQSHKKTQIKVCTTFRSILHYAPYFHMFSHLAGTEPLSVVRPEK
eukprot:scaffold170834_cov20-Prasinocladus_malaysianus.AAC.2